MKPFKISHIWGASPRFDRTAPIEITDIQELVHLSDAILSGSTYFSDNIYPTLELSSHYFINLEVSITPDKWRIAMTNFLGANKFYLPLIEYVLTDNANCTYFDFMNPQHSSFPGNQMLPKQAVLNAIEEWANRGSFGVSLAKLPT